MTVDKEAIRARAEAATPGPWDIYRYPHGGGRICIDDTRQQERKRELIADVESTGSDPERIAVAYNEADREFLYHARTDIPGLLDALDEAEARAERAEADAEQLAAELAKWGFGDFHYTSSDYRDPNVLAALAAHEAAVAARGESAGGEK